MYALLKERFAWKGLWLLDEEEGAVGVCRKLDEIDMTVAQEPFNHQD